MEPGLLNRKIRFYTITQQPTNRGGRGEPVLTAYWETNASEKPLTASRKLESNQIELVSVTIFLIRFREDKSITKDMQLEALHTGRKYVIQSVTESQDDRRMLEVRAALKQ